MLTSIEVETNNEPKTEQLPQARQLPACNMSCRGKDLDKPM